MYEHFATYRNIIKAKKAVSKDLIELFILLFYFIKRSEKEGVKRLKDLIAGTNF